MVSHNVFTFSSNLPLSKKVFPQQQAIHQHCHKQKEKFTCLLLVLISLLQFFLLLDRSWSGNTALILYPLEETSWYVGVFPSTWCVLCIGIFIYNPCGVQWKMLSEYGVFAIEPFVKCYSDHVLFRLCSEHQVTSQTCFWTSPKLHFVTNSAHNIYEDRIWRHSQRSEDGARK